MKRTDQFVWCVAYIDKDHIDKLQKDLNRSNQYIGVEAQVPVVKVLKKQFKNKDHFNEVPLLFNYGFFKIPILWAINGDLLKKIKDDITCISGWVKDPAKVFMSHSRSDLTKSFLLGSRDVPCATATDEEVAQLVRFAREESIHSSTDIDKLKIGTIVNLMGYPFEGMQAMVEEIDKKGKKVTVILKMDIEDEEDDCFGGNPIKVSFDNVFYSIYQGSFDEDYNKERVMSDVFQYKPKNSNDENE